MLRLAGHVGMAGMVVLGSVALGMAGYVWLEGLNAWDAFLHSAMLLAGMGLVATPTAPGAKLFAGLYALYSGLVFVAAAGIVLAPAMHRLLHKFHWQEGDGEAD